LHVPSLIEKKRDDQTLTTKEIKTLVEDFTLRGIPDYQVSTLAMAVYFGRM
jgi:thymidine phosphorylase